MYIYIFFIDHFAHSQQPRSILYWAELLRCSQGSSTPRVCAWFAGCPATSEPAMEIHWFPDIFGHDPMVDFPHLRFTIGSGMCWRYVCYVLFEGILAVQTWRSHGEKSSEAPRTAAWKQPLFFLQCALQQTKGLGSTVDLDHLFIIYEILYAVICSIYGLSISAGLHIMSATCSTWFRWRYVN